MEGSSEIRYTQVTQSCAHSLLQAQIFSNSGQILGKSKNQIFLFLSNFAQFLCPLLNIFFGIVSQIKCYTAIIDIRLIRLKLIKAGHFPRLSVKLIKDRADYEKKHSSFRVWECRWTINRQCERSWNVPCKKNERSLDSTITLIISFV